MNTQKMGQVLVLQYKHGSHDRNNVKNQCLLLWNHFALHILSGSFFFDGQFVCTTCFIVIINKFIFKT